MEALSEFNDTDVVSLAGGLPMNTAAFARKWGIPHHSLDLDEALSHPASKRQLSVGKHVLLEIPMALNVADAHNLAKLEATSGLTCVGAHTQRFSNVYSGGRAAGRSRRIASCLRSFSSVVRTSTGSANRELGRMVFSGTMRVTTST